MTKNLGGDPPAVTPGGGQGIRGNSAPWSQINQEAGQTKDFHASGEWSAMEWMWWWVGEGATALRGRSHDSPSGNLIAN